MKNQYFGDVGDYVKYSLLRSFANAGVHVGLNWYLTKNDNSTDGKYIQYLNDPREERFDPDLFCFLKKTVIDENTRDVIAIEKSNMIVGATYYHEILDISKAGSADEKRNIRHDWHHNAMDQLKDAEFVFLDPDNGMTLYNDSTRKDTIKYAYASEIKGYYSRGQNIAYYCHKGRRTYNQWEATKGLLKSIIPDARFIALTFHRGTQRTFLFAIHREDFKRYNKIIHDFFTSTWQRNVTIEPVDDQYDDSLPTGEKLTIELKNNITMTIETTIAGDVCIRFSNIPNRYIRMDADQFARTYMQDLLR